jgi:hypothetical protein
MKKQFVIIETTAQHCRAYKQATKGRENVGEMEALTASEALEEWLADLCLTYGISRTETGFVKDSDTERYVWQEGDSSADFGDFTVSAEELPIHSTFNNLFGTLGEMFKPLTIRK